MNENSVDTVIKVEGMSHSYGNHQAVRDLSIDVKAGEIVGLMGPNGSGKSTAFSLLSGLLPMTTGNLHYRGSAVSPDDWNYRCDLGVVFQDVSLDHKLTVEENLRLTARMHGLSGNVEKQVVKALDRAGFPERKGDRVGTLSGGLRRRLDIARAMIHEPRFLLMDEPTTGLDLESFEQTWRLLDKLRSLSETAILLTTHRPDEALRCDRLVVMREGACLRTATPEELLQDAGDDLLLLETSNPETVIATLKRELDLPAEPKHKGNGHLSVQLPRAQEWVVPIAGLFEPSTVRAISVRRPGLAEAYLKVTGSTLSEQPEKRA